MIKYLSIFILVISFIGCQNESGQDQSSAQDQQPMDGPTQDQIQQPSVDVNVSDDELELFVDTAVRAQEVQMEAQQEMMAVVEQEGIDVQTYNQIAEAQHTGQSTDELDVSSEDLDKFTSASEQIDIIEQESQEQVTSAVEENGLEMDRFQEINMAVQQDPDLQQKVQSILQESQGPPAQQPPQPDGF